MLETSDKFATALGMTWHRLEGLDGSLIGSYQTAISAETNGKLETQGAACCAEQGYLLRRNQWTLQGLTYLWYVES